MQWLDTLEVEHANLGAALAFCLADAESTECGLRLASALRLFWSVRGYGVEVVNVLDSLLDKPEPVPAALLAQALTTTAYVLEIHGAFEEALARAGHAVEVTRTAGEKGALVEALLRFGSASRRLGDLEGAMACYEEALQVVSQLAAPDASSDPAMLARCAGGRAAILGELGREHEARTGLTESLAALARVGDRWDMAAMLCDLALVELRSSAHEPALSQLEKALAVTEDLGDEVHKSLVEVGLGLVALLGADTAGASKWYSQAFMTSRATGNRAQLTRAVTGLAVVASAFGEDTRSASLHGAAGSLTRRMHFAREPLEVDLADDDRERLRARMGSSAFDRAFEDGAGLSDAELTVLTLARSDSRPYGPSHPEQAGSTRPDKQVGAGGLACSSR